MSFLLKETIHQSLSSTLYNEVFSGRSTYHYFIGRILDWDNPSIPATPNATGDYEYDNKCRYFDLIIKDWNCLENIGERSLGEIKDCL